MAHRQWKFVLILMGVSLGGLGASTLTPAQQKAAAAYYFSMAEALSLDEHWAEAGKLYEMATHLDPGSSIVWLKQAAAQERLGQEKEALTSLEAALRLDPKNSQAWTAKGRLLSQMGESAGAIEAIEKALKVDPNSPEIQYYAGVAAFEKGDLNRAAKLFRGLIGSDNENAPAYLMLAEIQRRQNNLLGAMKTLDQALERFPRFIAAANAKGILLEAQGAPKAQAFYREYLKTMGDNPSEQAMQMVSRLSQLDLAAGDYASAEPLLKLLQKSDPDNANVAVRLGLVQAEMKRWDDALVTFQSIQKKFPDSDRIAFYLGLVHDERGDGDAAMKEYAKVPSGSEHYETTQLREAILLKKKDGKKSLDSLHKRYAAFPSQAAYPLLIASVLEEAEGATKAIEFLEKEQAKFPKEERLLIQIAALYDKMEQSYRGIPAMEALLKINSKSSFAHNFIGYTLLEQRKEIKKAERHIRQAYAMAPKDAYIMDSYAWMLHKQGNHAKAQKILEEAASIRPDEAIIWEHLAEVYEVQKLWQRASAALMKAKELIEVNSPKHQQLQSRLATILQIKESSERAPAAKRP